VLKPVLVRDSYADEIMRTVVSFSEGITRLGRAAPRGRPLEPGPPRPRVRTVPGTPMEPEALICVPLIARGTIKGALNIYREGDGVAFSEMEFEVAKRSATRPRVALETRREPRPARASGAHRLAHRPLPTTASSTSGLLQSLAGGCEHARLGRSAHARHRRLQARQRRPRPRRRRRAAPLPRRGAARDHPAEDVVCRLGGEEFAIRDGRLRRRGRRTRLRADPEPPRRTSTSRASAG